ncbi:MAG: FecR family protein [Burkholderiaceae bacterium]
MRTIRALILALTFGCASATGWTQTPAAPAQGQVAGFVRVGTLKAVEGQAWLLLGEQQRTAAPGLTVRHGERLVTGPESAATVTLRDGTTLSLGPDSEVDLSEFAFDATTQEGHLLVRILQGSMRVITGLLSKVNPDLVRISTPTSVVGVRGTDFIVEVKVEPPRWDPAAGEFNLHDKL